MPRLRFARPQTALAAVAALFVIVPSCVRQEVDLVTVPVAASAPYRYMGRVDSAQAGQVDLIGVASYVEFGFTGDSIEVFVSAEGGPAGYSFATVEVDGVYRGRFEIPDGDTTRLSFSAEGDGHHRLRLSQASEQWVGALIFYGAAAESVTRSEARRGLAAFFGDSISAGAGSDTTGKSCDEEFYGDLANGFLAFPARAARMLELDYVVHAQSGRGLYVNWNAEDPPLPAILGHLSMDTADQRAYDISAEDPVLAVVALGTNDINAGPERSAAPFDTVVYESVYDGFIDRLTDAYPRADFVLVTSPMAEEPIASLLTRSIHRVLNNARARHPDREFAIANVNGLPNNGCSNVPHPTIDDQVAIAERVAAAARTVL